MPPDETYVGMVGPADFQNLNESLRICKIHTGTEGFPVSRDWSQVYSHDLEICLACRAAWRYRSCHFFLSRYNHIYSTTPYICILAREDQHTYIEFVLGKSWGCSLISQCSFPIQCTRNHDLLHRIRMLGILKHVVPQKFWKTELVEPCYMSVGCIFSARTATSVAAPS